MKHNLPLCAKVQESLETYFDHLDGSIPRNLYQMVLSEVEVPLFKVVMKQVGNNQSKTADILGLSRGTLRKKLQQYGLDRG